MTIELTTKQLSHIKEIQTKKKELARMFTELNTQETLILDLVLEGRGITEQPVNAALEDDKLVLTFKPDSVEEMGSKEMGSLDTRPSNESTISSNQNP